MRILIGILNHISVKFIEVTEKNGGGLLKKYVGYDFPDSK